MRDLQRIQRHLDDGERAQDHRRVDMAHMGDAEGLAVQFANPDAEHDTAFFLAIAMQWHRVITVRHDRGNRIGALGCFGNIDAEHLALRPARHGASHGLAEQAMALKGVFQPLGEQHVDRLAQREQQVHRCGAGISAIVLRPLALGPVPIGSAQVRLPVHFACAVAGGDESEAGRRHQALLRAGYGDIDAPGVHLERHAAERGHGVDHEEGGVAARLDSFADRLDVVPDTGRRVDLRHEYRLDRVRLVLPQPLFHLIWPHRAAPIALQHLDLDAHQPRGDAPADREASTLQHQYLVAAGQHIGNRRFPGAVTVGDVDVRPVPGREQFGEVGMQAVAQLDHVAGIDVQCRTVHGLQHLVGHCGGSGDGQKFPARANGHWSSSLSGYSAMLARPRAVSKSS